MASIAAGVMMHTGSPCVLMLAYTLYESDARVIRAAEAAASGGFSVDVLALTRPGQPWIEQRGAVRILRLPQTKYRGRSKAGYLRAYGEFFVRALAAAARLSSERRYAVVHVHNMPDALVFAAVVPRLRGARIILDIHDPMPETLGAKYPGSSGRVLYRMLLALEKLSVRFAAKTLTVNEPVRARVLIPHGHPPHRIDVVANFADQEIFAPMPPAPVNGRIHAVFHGSILERYGLRTLLDALSRMHRRCGLRVHLIGDGDFSPVVRSLLASYRLHDAVTFTNRTFPLDEIPVLLADAHVGLVPLDPTPISDLALPLKLVEYSCLGLPSIAARTTAISHYFSPEECLFYTPGDAAGLARILDGIVDDPAILDRYRARQHEVRRRLSWSTERDKYVAILHDLAGIRHDAAAAGGVTPAVTPRLSHGRGAVDSATAPDRAHMG